MKTPYNPTLHLQVPHFQEVDELDSVIHWNEWLKKTLMSNSLNSLNSEIPKPIHLKSAAELKSWTWKVSGLAKAHPVSTEMWTQILEVLPSTSAWDAKIKNNEPWILTLLQELDFKDWGIASWIEASLKNNKDISYLKSENSLFSIEIDSFPDKIGHLLLKFWFDEAKINDLKWMSKWTSLVSFWSTEVTNQNDRWQIQGKHTSLARELLISQIPEFEEHFKSPLGQKEILLRKHFESLPDFPIFERMPWQNEKIRPQWYASFEVALSVCGTFPKFMFQERSKSWFDVLNELAVERSKEGPHILPIGDNLWNVLKKNISQNDQPLWEKVWLNARVKSSPSDIKQKKQRL